MSDYVLRMHECGIPLRTATRIYRDFKTRGKLDALGKYIRYLEAMSNGRVETVSE